MLKYTERAYQDGAKKALTDYGLRPKDPDVRVGWSEQPQPPKLLINKDRTP